MSLHKTNKKIPNQRCDLGIFAGWGVFCLFCLNTYRAGGGVKLHNARCEQALDMATTHHIVSGKDMQLGWRDERYGIAQRERNIQLVRREEYALLLIVRQAAKERT